MSLDALVRALSVERKLADWSARAVYSRAAWLVRGADASSGERTETALSAVVHRDSPAGRGSASFTLGTTDALEEALEAVLMRSAAAIGPAWRTPLPAAPAKVTIADGDLDAAGLARAPTEIADQVAAASKAAGAELVELRVEVAIEAVRVVTHAGLDGRWPATRLTFDARLRRDGAVARVRRTVRRRNDLAVGVVIADAVDAGVRRARALAPPSGRIPVVVRPAALLHGGRGFFEALVAQADPALERQGLVRYRPGQPIASGSTTGEEPLTVTSDGTLPFGLRSAPLDEHGAAVRRFELVGRGVARDLALDGREAALRETSPNGGVRGIVVGAGGQPEAALLGGGPLLVVEAWSWFELAPVTGDFRASIALGRLIDSGGSHDVTGGVVRGDALAALARSRRSRELVTTPEYRGPATWYLGDLSVD